VETTGGFGVEADNPGALYQASGIELFASPNHFNGAPPADTRIVLQPILSPGRDPRHPQPRSYIYDNRPADLASSAPPYCEYAASHEGPRVIYEVRIPWSQFGVTPHEGMRFGVQIHANDADDQKRRTQLRWNTAPGKGQALRLVGPGSVDSRGTATAAYDANTIRVVVRSKPQQKVRAESGMVTAEAVTAADGRAILHLPMPAWGQPGESIRVLDETGTVLAWIELPDATKARHAILESMPVTFSGDNVFAGGEFPPLDSFPEAAKSLIEPGSASVRFFNRAGEECAEPGPPGRHFAIVTLRSKGGKDITRRIDLFHSKMEIDDRLDKTDGELAAAAGIAPPRTDADHILFASVRQHVFDPSSTV